MALPSGYTELEYIESTGEQYLDAGFIPDQDTRIYAEAVLPISSGSTQALFGCRVSSSSRQFQFVTQGGYYRSDYNTTISNFTTHDYGTEKFYIDKNKQNTDLNGEYSTSHTYGAFTCPGNMFIFATNNNGSLYALSSARLYVLKRWNNGTLANHFIPCKNDTDEVGMWDDVNSVFHGNMGSGTFVAGPEVVPENPMAPHDGHNTNIEQVAREIEAGAALIGGVSRGIESGLVLIGGVAREIEIVETVQMFTVEILSAVASSYDSELFGYGNVIVNGVTYNTYTSATIEVELGMEINLSGTGVYEYVVYIDGARVASGAGSIDYSFTINNAVRIERRYSNTSEAFDFVITTG